MAQESDGAQLHGEPEAIVLTPSHVDQVPIGRVKVEVAVELSLIGSPVYRPYRRLLVGAEEPLAPPGQPWLGRPRLELCRRQPACSAPGVTRRYW